MTALMYPPTSNGLQKSLNANLDQGETTSLTLNNTTGIQNKPGVIVINRIDTNGVVLSSSLREYVSFTGVSGSTLTGLTRGLGGSSDQDHSTGEVVEFVHDVVIQQAVIDALALVVDEDDITAVNTTNVVTPTGTQTLTNKTLTTPQINDTSSDHQYVFAGSELTADRTVTLPLLLGNDTFVFADFIQTLTNKRITPRIVKTTDDATSEINIDTTDQYELTAVANATTFTVTGTPTDGQKLIVRITDAGVTKGLTWTGFTAKGATPPTATTAGKTHYVGFIYSSTDSTWDCVAAIVEE